MNSGGIKEITEKLIEFLKTLMRFIISFLKDVWDSGVIQKYTRLALHYVKVFILEVIEFSKLLHSKLLEFFKRLVKELRNFDFTLTNIFRIIAVGKVIGILFLLFLSYQVNYRKPDWEGDKKFRISPGMPFNDIADLLEKEGVISNSFYFKVAAKLQGKDDRIISRTYILKTSYNNLELLNVLTDPSLNYTVKFTVIEGIRIKKIAKLSAAKFNFSEALFVKESQNDSLINLLGLKGKVKDLEGFLYPDTYNLPVDISPKELVEVLFNEFYKKVIASGKYGLKENPKKLLETVTLASIVQGETQLESEMPTIAGVYLNRIAKRMKLEADPTIQYALPDGPKQRLLKSDLKVNSPYNTYLNYGLPPGPINNPGLKAIESVLNYDKHNYIFFVATGKGGHKFTATYKEHLEAVAEYRKNVKQK
ncbi:MAG: endolytic transglycosylase MltG [Ignavibacteriae bacterium]|nr:endolytic transglycosylase MltG [Ignavibacteriota bacterium]